MHRRLGTIRTTDYRYVAVCDRHHHEQPGRPPAVPDPVRIALWKACNEAKGVDVKPVYSIDANGVREEYGSVIEGANAIGVTRPAVCNAIRFEKACRGRRWFYLEGTVTNA